jgi:DNA recombination protein RmuC
MRGIVKGCRETLLEIHHPFLIGVKMHWLPDGAEFLQTAFLLALPIIVVLLGLNAVLVLILLRGKNWKDLKFHLESVDKNVDRSERSLRDEIARNREETTLVARQGREETGNVLKSFGDSLQVDSKTLREEVSNSLKIFSDSVLKGISTLTESNEHRLEGLRNAIDVKLKQIQEDNSRQLEQMRATVDEKLQGTLEKRLGESFRQVSERLEQVHKGLGEMQALATGVGDLKRVLTNVKTRGVWGEIQLGALLEQILSPQQYDRNVKTKENSAERVEFAVKLPGRGEEDGKEVVWLPIDAKFPVEDYQRLIDAQEPEAAEQAERMLSVTVKNCAKTICDKYLDPPATTDFGIMFLPTEGLYAEVTKRASLVESIQRECHVVVAGPSTMAALLNSLQMGFRTLAMHKRSSEIRNLLGAVKTEFGRFGMTLEGVKKKLDQASNTMDEAARRSRVIERKLRNVEEIPSEEAQALLGANGMETEPAEE